MSRKAESAGEIFAKSYVRTDCVELTPVETTDYGVAEAGSLVTCSEEEVTKAETPKHWNTNFIVSAGEDPATCSGDEFCPKGSSIMLTSLSSCSMGRLGRSREPEALSRVKSQEHELKQTDVGTDCVELTPVDMETLMVEAGSPVACSGEEVTMESSGLTTN